MSSARVVCKCVGYRRKEGSRGNLDVTLACCVVLCCVVLCCVVLCCVVLCCVVLCCVMLCCVVLCCVVLCCAVLCCVVLFCVVLCCVLLCCGVVWCGVVSCAVLCCAVLPCVVRCGVLWCGVVAWCAGDQQTRTGKALDKLHISHGKATLYQPQDWLQGHSKYDGLPTRAVPLTINGNCSSDTLGTRHAERIGMSMFAIPRRQACVNPKHKQFRCSGGGSRQPSHTRHAVSSPTSHTLVGRDKQAQRRR